MKLLDLLNTSKKIFQEMLEKLLLRKFCKIIKKTSLVASILKNLNWPIHPPLTIGKLTSPQIFPLFLSRILKSV